MIGNFRLARKFASALSKYIYEDVFFDRFNSVFKGFYLIVPEHQLGEMVQTGSLITFIKVPSTERFGSQDVTQLEFCDPDLITPDQKKLIYLLNSVIDTGQYTAVPEN